jgi:WD40 repeat protein
METQAIAPIPNMAPKQESLKDKLLRYLLGEDIFISYSRQDGTTYALALARKLSEKNFSCKFDQWGTTPGKDLPQELQLTLRRSEVLVLVCTELAAKSESVGKEINIFLETGRYIIPIDVDGSLANSVWKDRIFGIPESSFAKNVITEAEHGASNEPSDDVLRRISDTFTYKRKNERLRKAAMLSVVAITVFFLLALAGSIVAGYQIDRATTALNEATQARQLADQAKIDASNASAEAQRQTERAGKETQRAEDQTRIANDATEQSKLARAEAEKQTALASQKQKEAAEAAEKTRQLSYASNVQLASRIYQSGLVDEFISVLGGVDESLRGFEWHYLEDLPKGLVNFDTSKDNVGAVLFSPDGRYLVTGGENSSLQLWDVHNGSPAKKLQDEEVRDFTFSPDGKWFASCEDSVVSLWKTTDWTEQPIDLFPESESERGQVAHHRAARLDDFQFVSFSPDSRLIFAVSNKGKEVLLRGWNTETGKLVGNEQSISKQFAGKNPIVKRFAYNGEMIVRSDDGTFLLGTDLSQSKFEAEVSDREFRYAFFPDGRVALVKIDAGDPQAIAIRNHDLDPKSERVLEESRSETKWIDITVSSNGKFLAALRQGEVRIWNTETLKPVKVIFVKSIAASIAFSADSSQIAVGGSDDLESDSFLGIWNVGSSDTAFTFNNEHFLAASTDGMKVLTTRFHQDIHLWNAVSGAPQNLAINLQSVTVEKAAISPDASRAWAFIRGRNEENKGYTSLQVWNMTDGSEVPLKSKTECKHALATKFSSDSKRLVGFCEDGTIRLWSMDDGNELIKLEGEDNVRNVKSLFLTPNKLLVIYSNNTPRYWDLKTGARQPAEVCSEEVTDVSPDGEWWFTKDKDDNYYLRRVETKKCDEKDPLAENDRDPLTGAAFSDDGKFIAVFTCLLPTGTGDCEKILFVQKLESNALGVSVSEGFDNAGADVQFSPSGRWVQYGSKVWDRRTKKTFGIAGCAYSLTFAEDQNRVMTTCADGTLKFWSLTSGQELFALKAHNSKITETILLPDGRHLLTTNGDEVKLWRGVFH